MASEKIAECSRILATQQLKIAFAESATAGWMASEFALTEHSGKVLLGGIVCYDADIKQQLFGIEPEFLEKYTPESAEVTRELAERLNRFFAADVCVAVTGLTTPGGSETESKPVGTMFLHILLPNNRYCAHREVFSGTPEEIIKQTIDRTGILITELLSIDE